MLMETMELARNHENSANHAKNQVTEKSGLVFVLVAYRYREMGHRK
jgi:hypothetical protein